MGFNYAVLGAGRQGTATAYDLALFGDSDLILLADQDLAQAQTASERVNRLSERKVCRPVETNVKDTEAVITLLKDNKVSAVVSGVPYFFNLDLTRAAIKAGASLCDYGGNTDVVHQQLSLADQARTAGVTVIPDCGMAPGLGNSMCAYAVSLLDSTRELITYDCGLPQKPVAPWNYILTFSIEGLTNEYHGMTNCLRDGKLFQVPCFEEYELVDFAEPIGRLEAFTTAGGASTLPWTYQGKIKTLQNKTLRWPGHFAQWKVFQQAGLFEKEPIEVDGQRVIPRHVLHALMDPKIRARDNDRDMVIIRVCARGEKHGRPTEVVLDLFDYFNEKTGFTAMERATGFHAGIMASLMAHGKTPRTAITVEESVEPKVFLEEFNKRGFKLSESVHTSQEKQSAVVR